MLISPGGGETFFTSGVHVDVWTAQGEAVAEVQNVSLDANSLPALRLKATTWLSAPAQPLEAEVAAELRMSMFRRLEAVVASAPLTNGIAIIAVCRHTTPDFCLWAALDVALLIVRVTIVFHLIRRIKRGARGGFLDVWATDAFIIVGTVWSAVLGYGAFLTISSDDPGLVIMILFVCTAVLAVQTIRNPSSPRMNLIQMGLIVLPLSAGALFSPLPLVPWGGVLWPMYLAAMSNMTRQIHDDYVAMIVAQIENSKRARHCGLTGLPNRSFFDESLGAALRDTTTSKRLLAVLCIDLDGFKQVNDTYGHPLGDVLLIQVGARLKGLIRATDMTARLGGDEFAILMRGGDRAGAEATAALVNHTIAVPFTLRSDVTVRIGASVGLMVLDSDAGVEAVDANVVMTRADQALYAAKHAGKGTFRRFDESLVTAAQAA